MKKSAYGTPLFIDHSDQVSSLIKIEALDELSIQDIIFQHPNCLPISEIEESYNPVIPVCKELMTTVGPLDILMVSPNGELTIIETKLWRNPEARRIVVAQVLDYAKELSSWNYEDLQREVNRRLGTKGNTLYDLVLNFENPDLVPSESDFIDSVSRNLSRGKFLLLIAGDGIREGAKGIAEFLTQSGHLSFTFAMVEIGIYQAEGLGTLIIPKTLVKTVELSKMTIEVPAGLKITQTNEFEVIRSVATSPEKEWERNFYIKFWQELISELSFDDPGQPLPKPGNSTNLYVYPAQTKKAWISAYFAKSMKRVGVYFRLQNDQDGIEILATLNRDKEQIKSELGSKVLWTWEDNADVGVRLPCENVFADENREEIKDFFKEWLNTFVNVFRPRLKKYGY